MPRIARHRILYDGCFAHVFSRSIEKRRIFQREANFMEFLSLLSHFKKRHPFFLHHYCLMHTHFHLAVSIPNLREFSKALHGLKWAYTHSFNKRNGDRRGTLWQERFKSMLIEDDRYLYACGLYIETNPVQAGLVSKSDDWPYSSARRYVLGETNSLIDPYEPPSLPEGSTWKKQDFFTKGEVIGSELFKLQTQSKPR